MCEKTVEEYNHFMKWIPDELKTQGIYDEGFEKGYHLIEWFPEKYKMKNMCETAFENYYHLIRWIPEKYRTQEMCDDYNNLKHIPEKFMNHKL